MRKVISVFFIFLTLSACGGKTDQNKINIAVIGKAKTSYWDYVRLGAEAAGRDLGVKVRFFVPPTSAEDPAWQVRKIEELATESVDGIAFAASDPKSIAASILKAMKSEIPCIALDTDVSKSRHAYIGTGNYDAGQQSGEKMVELLGGKGKVAILTDPSAIESLQRTQGFRDVLAEHASVEVAAMIEKGGSAIQEADVDSLLNLHPDLSGIFCTSDTGGIATARAVQKANKAGKVNVICIGESSDVVKYVWDNVIQVAVSRRPYKMGYLSVLVLHNMARTGINNALMILPKSKMIDPGVVLITPSNVAQYIEDLKKLGIKVQF